MDFIIPLSSTLCRIPICPERGLKISYGNNLLLKAILTSSFQPICQNLNRKMSRQAPIEIFTQQPYVLFKVQFQKLSFSVSLNNKAFTPKRMGIWTYLKGIQLNYEISLFRDTFYFNKLLFRDYGKDGVKYTFSESSLQDQFRNCFKTMAVMVLKIIGTKVSYFTIAIRTHYKWTFSFIFQWEWPKFCLWGYQTSIIQIFLSLMAEELFLSNQENSYVMFSWRQLVNHSIYQASCLQYWILRIWKIVEKFWASSALR